jgi:hypothetical protein
LLIEILMLWFRTCSADGSPTPLYRSSRLLRLYTVFYNKGTCIVFHWHSRYCRRS